jgi:hypothetical protein
MSKIYWFGPTRVIGISYLVNAIFSTKLGLSGVSELSRINCIYSVQFTYESDSLLLLLVDQYIHESSKGGRSTVLRGMSYLINAFFSTRLGVSEISSITGKIAFIQYS